MWTSGIVNEARGVKSSNQHTESIEFRKNVSQNIGLLNGVREGLAIFYQMRYR